MPHRRELTLDDINEIKRLRNNIPVAEIADRYKISYQRIYKIWKLNPNDLPAERIIENEDEQQITEIIGRAGELTIQRERERERKREKSIQRDRESLQRERESILLNKLKSLQRENDNLKSLHRERESRENDNSLTEVQDLTRVRDRLRIELSDVKSQLNAAKHDNCLLIAQYDNLSEKYSALTIEVNNSRERLHEIESPKQHNDMAFKPEKKKKKKKILIWNEPTKEETEKEAQRQEFEKKRLEDYLDQLKFEERRKQVLKNLWGKNVD